MKYLIIILLLPVFSKAQKVEAEDYTQMSGVQTEKTTDSLGGLNVGWIEAKDWMEYVVEIREAGIYKVNLRIASTSPSKLEINGIQVDLPNTGAYQKWTTVTAEIKLDKGKQTIRITALTAGWNINWLELSPVKPPKPVEKSDSLWYIDVERRTFHILYTDKTTSDTLKLPR
jgi:hypothetical protein